MPGEFDGHASSARTAPLVRGMPAVVLLVLLGVALVAALVSLAWTGTGGGAWLFAALALVACTVLGLALGHELARRRHLEPLREARASLAAWNQLSASWLWQTDRDHRLLRLQPPHGAPASNWIDSAGSGQTLWECFDDTSGELRQRLQAQGPLPPLRARRSSPMGDTHWTLRGVPRLDAQGRFAGYIGVADPTDQDDARRVDQLLLQAVWRQAPLGLARLFRLEEGQPWQLLDVNAEAVRALGLPEGLNEQHQPRWRLPLPWAEVLAQAPAALRERLAHPEAPLRDDTGDWRVAIEPVPNRPELRLLTLAHQPVDEQQQAMAAEHAAFSYTVSHDLRAPIRVVEGFARILKEDYGRQIDRIGNDHLDRVLGAAARMNHMIDALLSLSKLSTQPLARQPVNLSQTAQWVVDDLRRATPERAVRVTVQEGLTAHGDPTLLRMLLENLLGNAWKYTGRTAGAEIVFERTQQKGHEVFVVRDNGAGFDMRFADRLFGVFQRLHGGNDFPGSGVGLASVRRIVRRHGGEIWAESEVGRGARFYFTLSS